MNKIVNKFSLAGDTFMPEMHLEQPGLLIVLVVHLLKKRKNWNIYKNWKSNCIYINDLNKACFQHNMVYGRSKDLARRTESDKVLRDKAFEIASNPKYDGYQRRLASMVYMFSDKKSTASGVATPNYQLANELHKQFIRRSKRRKFILHLKAKFGC